MKRVSNSAPAASANQIDLEVGNRVGHAKFGVVNVIGIEGSSPNQKATIDFDSIGKKQLLLKFAKLDLL